MSTTTGYCSLHLPEGPERDKALGLIRIGLAFKTQQTGRKPDAVTQYIALLVKQLPQASFANLLEKLEAESARHDAAAGECICAKVNRVHEVSTFFHPKRGEEVDVPFGTLKKKLTFAKKTIMSG